MTTSVRSVLSYDSQKKDFIAFKVDIFSKKIYIVVTDVVNDVTCSSRSVNTCVVITLFITWHYQLENSDVI